MEIVVLFGYRIGNGQMQESKNNYNLLNAPRWMHQQKIKVSRPPHNLDSTVRDLSRHILQVVLVAIASWGIRQR